MVTEKLCNIRFCSLSNNSTWQLGALRKTVQQFHARTYDRIIEIQSNLRRKKLHRANQGSNFLGRSFSNRYNVRAPSQFKWERQPQHLNRWFSLKNRPIHFYINSTSVIRPVKWNQLSFPNIEINQPFSAPDSNVLKIRFYVKKPILIVATDQMPDQ